LPKQALAQRSPEVIMTATAKPYAVNNRILSALPHEEYQRLQPHLELVHLSTRRTLSEAGDLIRHTYFLNSGMGSLLAVTQGGATVEIAMVGNEGMLGIPVVLGARKAPYRIMIQMPGDAMRIKADVLRAELKRGAELQDLLLSYTHALITQISQSAVCNRFHTMEKRLCRWLLIAHDRVDGDTFHLTQSAAKLPLLIGTVSKKLPVSATASWQKLSIIFSQLETDLSAMSGYRLSLVRDRQSLFR
jgi:CRP-like cAMP-binding protein